MPYNKYEYKSSAQKNKRRYQQQIIEFTHSSYTMKERERERECQWEWERATARSYTQSHTLMQIDSQTVGRTDRQIDKPTYCVPLYESNKPNHVYIHTSASICMYVCMHAEITSTRSLICICMCVCVLELLLCVSICICMRVFHSHEKHCATRLHLLIKVQSYLK